MDQKGHCHSRHVGRKKTRSPTGPRDTVGLPGLFFIRLVPLHFKRVCFSGPRGMHHLKKPQRSKKRIIGCGVFLQLAKRGRKIKPGAKKLGCNEEVVSAKKHKGRV